MRYIARILSLTLILSSPGVFAKACLDRISNIYVNLCEVQKVCMYPNRITTIDFPCEVEDPEIGPGGDAIIKLSDRFRRSLKLYLNSGQSRPTSLSVRCGEDIFVFDLVPSFSNHSDVVKINGVVRNGGCGSSSGEYIKKTSSGYSREKKKPKQQEVEYQGGVKMQSRSFESYKARLK